MQPHCCGADKLFDDKEARKSRKRYLKKGPMNPTKGLIKMMKPSVKDGDKLLDIGGGIGIIGLELQKSGLSHYTSVDASSGYQVTAMQLYSDKWDVLHPNFIHGDFVEEAGKLGTFDHVSLDKVICCYPQLNDLLVAAASKAKVQLGLVYPPSGWLSRLFRFFANTYMKIVGNDFRTYIHPITQVHAILEQQGFQLKTEFQKFPWRTEVWKRSA